MKRVLIILLTGLLVFSLAACKSKEDKKDSTENKTTEKQTSAEEKKPEKEESSVKDSVELLETVWNSYKENLPLAAVI